MGGSPIRLKTNTAIAIAISIAASFHTSARVTLLCRLRGRCFCGKCRSRSWRIGHDGTRGRGFGGVDSLADSLADLFWALMWADSSWALVFLVFLVLPAVLAMVLDRVRPLP